MKKVFFLLTMALFVMAVVIASSLTLSAAPEDMASSGNADSAKCAFPRAKHKVEGEFLAYCQQAPNPEFLFGLPITDAIKHPDGSEIQYFQRVVMQKTDNGVELVDIGPSLLEQVKKAIARTPLPTPHLAVNHCETVDGFAVCDKFLDFYRTYQTYTGKPISDAMWENGEVVQYFAKMRLEYRDGKVVPSDAGRWYFDLAEPNKMLLDPPPQGAAPQRGVFAIQATAEVKNDVVSRGEEQTLFILVTDQNANPLEGAEVTVYLTTTENVPVSVSGGTLEATTNDKGVAKISFLAPDIITRIVVHVTVSYQDKYTTTTETTFRVWY